MIACAYLILCLLFKNHDDDQYYRGRGGGGTLICLISLCAKMKYVYSYYIITVLEQKISSHNVKVSSVINDNADFYVSLS